MVGLRASALREWLDLSTPQKRALISSRTNQGGSFMCKQQTLRALVARGFAKPVGNSKRCGTLTLEGLLVRQAGGLHEASKRSTSARNP